MPDARIDNLAVARKVRFRYTGGAYGCASGRGMGLSLEHDGRRRGYALSLTAGLLWGVGLVKLALSMSFSTVSFQLDGYSSLGMLVGFGGSLALFVPLSVQKAGAFLKAVRSDCLWRSVHCRRVALFASPAGTGSPMGAGHPLLDPPCGGERVLSLRPCVKVHFLGFENTR